MSNPSDHPDRISRLFDNGSRSENAVADPYPGRLQPATNGILADEDVLRERALYREERLRQAKERTARRESLPEPPNDVPEPIVDAPKAPPVTEVPRVPPASPKPDETVEPSTPPFDEDPADEFTAPTPSMRPLYEIQFFMERPFFAIPHKGPIELRPYTKDGFFIQAKALDEALGVATIDDAEILMVICTELLTAMLEDPGCREVTLKPAHTLGWIRRGTGKNQYDAFYTALKKLCTTEITTNIGPDGQKGATITFTFLESWEASTKRLIRVRVSDWVAAAIINKKAIRIPNNYFELSRGFERWLCRVACKHLGPQEEAFRINLDTLHEKSGSNDDFASFRYKIKQIIKAGRLLDHVLTLVEDRQLKISPRSVEPYVPAERAKRTPKPPMKLMR